MGDAFVGELEQVFEQLSELPLSGPPFRGKLRHRPLFTFPYRVVYSVRGDGVLVLAIMHQRRGPRYMVERLRGEEIGKGSGMTVDFGDIEDAYLFVSSGTRYEHQAYLCRETGEISFSSEMGESDELPDDVDSDRYLPVPDKWELDLGEPLVMEFVARHLPEGLDAVHVMCRKRGAYARFKAFLDERDLLQRWYDYQADAETAALTGWCEENGIDVGPARRGPPDK